MQMFTDIVLYHFIINFSESNSTCCLTRANVSWKCYYIEIIVNIIMSVVLPILIQALFLRVGWVGRYHLLLQKNL